MCGGRAAGAYGSERRTARPRRHLVWLTSRVGEEGRERGCEINECDRTALCGSAGGVGGPVRDGGGVRGSCRGRARYRLECPTDGADVFRSRGPNQSSF